MVGDLAEPEAVGIAGVAERTGLTPDTLRWYEREGLFPRVARGADGRRRYDEQSIQRIELHVRLRATGMPTKEMRTFVDLLGGGTETHQQRLQLLAAHRERICRQQQQLADCLQAVDAKIEHYRRLGKDNT